MVVLRQLRALLELPHDGNHVASCTNSLPNCKASENLSYRNANKDLIKALFRLEKDVSTRAVVLCAGQGTRLRPLTNTVPKCMVKFQGHCIIDTSWAALELVESLMFVSSRGIWPMLSWDDVRYAVNTDLKLQTW